MAVDNPTTASYPANHPIEDRNVSFAMGAGVRVAAVFDGHGGWQCSDFAVSCVARACMGLDWCAGPAAGAAEPVAARGPLA